MDTIAPIASGILVALATAFFTSRFYAKQVRADLEKELQGRFNERRWQVYLEFAELLFKLLQATSDNRLDKEMPRVARDLRALTTKLWLVASDDVVRSFIAWRRTTPADESTGERIKPVVSLIAVLVSMRKDLGDTETDITAREMLSTFLNDIDQVLDGAKG